MLINNKPLNVLTAIAIGNSYCENKLVLYPRPNSPNKDENIIVYKI